MQHVLQKYALHTCHESTQSGPLIVWFHPIVIHVYFIHTTSLMGDKEF
jgi:hypothetical protein